MRKIGLLGIGLFILGVLFRAADTLDFIHEFMHIIMAASEGQEVVSYTNSSATFQELNPAIIYGGYYGEAMMYGGLTFIIAFIYKPAAMFFFGIFHVVAFSATGSDDFNRIAMNYFGSNAIVEANIQRWTIFMVIGLGVLWLIIITCGSSLTRQNIPSNTSGKFRDHTPTATEG